MHRTANRGRRAGLLATLVLTMALAGACIPPPEPPAPSWSATRLARDAAADPPVNRVGAWTNEEWFATVEQAAGTDSVLAIHRRSGAGGSVLGSPQRIALPGGGGLLGGIGDEVLGVQIGSSVQFFREQGGVWSASGSLPVPADHELAGVTDDWVVLRRVPDPSLTSDGDVEVHALDLSGPGVSATLAATLRPEAAWPAALRADFGRYVALDGDLIAVSAQASPHPGVVRIFRAEGGQWQATQTLGGEPGTPSSFGRSPDVDDGTEVDRLVVAPAPTSPDDIAVPVYVDSGEGFVLEQSIARDSSLPDVRDGLLFGMAPTIDGDRLAFPSRAVLVPSSEPGHADVEVGHIAVHRLRGTWVPETELAPFVAPYDPGVRSALPDRLELVGTHLAVRVLMNLDPPPGCPFPCFATLGFEAWSFDRVT